jgi:hypothetical protein
MLKIELALKYLHTTISLQQNCMIPNYQSLASIVTRQTTTQVCVQMCWVPNPDFPMLGRPCAQDRMAYGALC